MKCIVNYLSVTGNTEKIARAIQLGVKQVAGNCEIVKLSEANPRRFADYDLIGLGSPVYGPGPFDFQNFIKDMRGVGGKHAFVFCTHGLLPYHYFPNITSLLRNRDMVVIGWQQWYGNACNPWHLYPYASAGHPDEIDLKDAENFGKEMAERSQRISSGEIQLIPKALEMPSMDPPPVAAAADLCIDDLKYHQEKCLYPNCRLCMDNCPQHSIDLTLNPRVITQTCNPHCALCTMICPSGALEIDEWFEHQNDNWIEVEKELTLANIAKQEAEGYNYRMLVPKEELYKFNTTAGMICKKHPKFIIGKGLQIG